MLRLMELKLPLDHTEDDLKAELCARLKVPASDVVNFTIARRGYDARKTDRIFLIYTLDVELKNQAAVFKRFHKDHNITPTPDTTYKLVTKAPAAMKHRPVVVGFGPCGLFVGFLLAEMGFKPIILERGKVVRERTVDTFGLWRKRILNPNSNVQFGEGGAGTFSDGKLYSGIKDGMNRVRKVLVEFAAAGAPDEILFISKPHIGTFRLVSMIENMRAKMIEMGAEIRFQNQVTDIEITEKNGERRVRGVVLDNGERLETDHLVMAVGHSARDTFQMVHDLGIFMEAKPFSIGVRIEHPQAMINERRFGKHAGHPLLGAADYKLVHHCSNGRSVYSFCMCPGGTVVAATSEPGRVVTNGMSQYRRAQRNANSGIVVGITPDDYPGGVLAGIDFQRHWEDVAFKVGGENYNAPGQLVGDFLAGRASTALGSVTPSYKPGLTLTDLSQCLPDYAVAAIREAMPVFGRQLKGYDMPDAVMTAVETRTSAPIRITRDESFQSLNTKGLYPAGEGAGYAGGILSAAVDGIRVAEAVALSIAA
ncbi:MAG: NAD(P)/FAD-dependent oxidoreductase [Rhodospirillaceae bacterium]|nr:NAD(P)/FAD-dependent oxidoreductase [Rhodospirillaceae bacterium]